MRSRKRCGTAPRVEQALCVSVKGGGAVPLGFHCISCVKACPVALHVVEVEVQFCVFFFSPAVFIAVGYSL